jgi:hypothetical protein
VGLLLAVLARAGAARAEEPRRAKATFALLVGSNDSVDANVPPLKYADDDAARYLDLFRLLGARTYLLTRLDEDTRRLHPQAAAEAMEPKRAAFDQAVAELGRDVAQAAARGVDTVVYIVYAGHGNVENGQGYVTLEDGRITGAELARTVAQIPATRVHVIVDACASYYLATSRGPGGERRPIRDFRSSALVDDTRVGVLLSTSSARESHEWEAFQGGVFSHEVRSGLYGAADADGDGEVTYREIAAFVARANAAIPNERYRPDVFALAPRGSDALLDIREGLKRRLEVDGRHAAHYLLEDARGVRLADFHNAPGQGVSLVRPSPSLRLYLRNVDEEHEYVVDPLPEVVALADLTASEPVVRPRGAANESFGMLFSLPFDARVVADFRETLARPPAPPPVEADAHPPPPSSRKVVGGVILGVGLAGLAAGAVLTVAANAEGNAPANESEAAAAGRNGRITTLNTGSAIAYVAGGVAAGVGVALLLWPSTPTKNVVISATPGGAGALFTTAF